MDDSEVTLNVCLGKQFSGGELYFRGVRCVNHMDSPTGEEVIVKSTIIAIIVSFIIIVCLVMSSQPQGCFHHVYSELELISLV